jgi:hypothetical protein
VDHRKGMLDVRNAALAVGIALLHYHQYDYIYSGMRTQTVRGAPAAGTVLREGGRERERERERERDRQTDRQTDRKRKRGLADCFAFLLRRLSRRRLQGSQHVSACVSG